MTHGQLRDLAHPGVHAEGGAADTGGAPWRVALLSRIVGEDAAARARMTAAGIDVVADLPSYEARRHQQWWSDVLGRIDALVVGLQPVDRALLAAAPRLRYVLRVGTGLDNVDLDAARDRGVAVRALPGANATAVAEYAFALLLAAARRVVEVDSAVRAGQWPRLTGRQLGGRTLGLVGFGAIGRAMVPMARGFGMDVLVHRRRPDLAAERAAGVRAVDLAELLSVAEFVSLHAPLTPQTHHMIGRREVELMRQTVLVNTARGGLVDAHALHDGLRSGRVAACALDVFEDEPPDGSPLLCLPNVVLSSHNAGYGDQAVADIARAAVDALLGARAAESQQGAPPDEPPARAIPSITQERR